MNLNDQQQKAFNAWLISCNIPAACAACGLVKIEPPKFVAVPAFDPVNRVVKQGDITPLVQSVCSTCGHARHFSAKMAGLIA